MKKGHIRQDSVQIETRKEEKEKTRLTVGGNFLISQEISVLRQHQLL